MKIAYIVRNYNKDGGISKYVNELAQNISVNNDVHVFSSTINDSGENIIKHIVPYLSFNYLKQIKKYYLNVALEVLSFMITSIGYVNRDKYDIIHSQGDFRGQCDIYTAHSCHKAWLKIARENSSGLIDKLKKSNLNPLHILLLKSEHYGIIKSRKIIAISEEIKKELITNYSLSKEKICVIPNGINTERFSIVNKAKFRKTIREIYSLKETDVVAIFPAHEFKRKGLSQIIDALSIIKKNNIYLLVMGRDNPSKYHKVLKDNGLLKNVIFVGEQLETEKYYAASDMMVFPTLYEPFGLVITEAMASGLPVLVSANAGAAELMTDGIDGLFIKDRNDIQEIAQKIEWLYVNTNKSIEIGNNARKTAEKYSWRVISNKTLDLYEKVLKEKIK